VLVVACPNTHSGMVSINKNNPVKVFG